jgi:hypothetical protein
MDEDTVYKIWLIDSLFVGVGVIPHTPPPGRNPPRTPGMNCDGYLLDEQYAFWDSKEIVLKDHLVKWRKASPFDSEKVRNYVSPAFAKYTIG